MLGCISVKIIVILIHFKQFVIVLLENLLTIAFCCRCFLSTPFQTQQCLRVGINSQNNDEVYRITTIQKCVRAMNTHAQVYFHVSVSICRVYIHFAFLSKRFKSFMLWFKQKFIRRSDVLHKKLFIYLVFQ